MLTIKAKYTASAEMQEYLVKLRKQQSCCIRYAYNRYQEKMSDTEVARHLKKLNNIQDLDSWFIVSAAGKGHIYSKLNADQKKRIFGGKKAFIERKQQKITKEQWKAKRLEHLISVGESLAFGNRKFKLDILNGNLQIIFKPKLKNRFTLQLCNLKGNFLKHLAFIQQQAELKKQPFTVMLDENYIHIIFEPEQQLLKTKKNRVFSLDLNPNKIGYSVLEFRKDDSFKVIDSGIVDNTELTSYKHLKGKSNTSKESKYYTNKKTFEVYQISKFLAEKAKHYRCAKFVIEDLTITPKNHQKGRNFNRLINNSWNRTKLELNLKKRCEIAGIEFLKVNSAYSSFVGNACYSANFPDPICSAIEIGRRGYKKFEKLWFYPKVVKHENLPNQWKKEVGSDYCSWIELYNKIKNVGITYHISSVSGRLLDVFSLQSPKSKVKILEKKDAVSRKIQNLYCFS